jgi:hypothetical protein
VIVRGDLLLPTEEITLEAQEAAVALPTLHLIAAAAELGAQRADSNGWSPRRHCGVDPRTAVQADQIRAVAAARTWTCSFALDAHAPTFYHSSTIQDEHLVVADGLGAIRLHDPEEIAWQIEVFTRMQRAALDPAASRALPEDLAIRFATR